MKSEVKVTVVQFAPEQAIFDENKKQSNVERIVRYIEQLGSLCDLLVFPELSTTGYIPIRGYLPESKINFWKLSEDLEDSIALREIEKAVNRTGCLCVFGFAERARVKGEIFNSAALVEPGQFTRVYRKVHIPVEEMHYFTPGSGTQVYPTRIGKIGIAICYDLIFPEIIRVLGVQGAEIVVIIVNAFNFANLKLMGEYLPMARALENQIHIIFCNSSGKLRGTKHELTLTGGSKIISSPGEIVAKSSTDEECVISGVITQKELENGASIIPVFRDRQIHAYTPLIEPLD